MKKLNLLMFALLAVFVVSCEDDIQDHATGDAREGGVIVNVTPYSVGKALGNPVDVTDITNTDVSFSDVIVDLTFARKFGGQGVTGYEITKTFFYQDPTDPTGSVIQGAEQVVASSETLPININYTTMAELMAGTEKTNSADLRIGEKWLFKTRYISPDGILTYGGPESRYEVTVACASDLAGTYSINYTGGPQNHIVTELSPGLYEIDSMMGWPGRGYAVTFTDVCGSLEIIDDWQFSNEIGGLGTVDASTGDLTFTDVKVVPVYSGRTYTLVKL